MRRLDARSVFSDGARRAASDGTINFDFGTKNGKFIFCHFFGSRQTLNAEGSRLKAGGSRLKAGGSGLEAGGSSLEAGGWKLEAGSWRLLAAGWG